MASPAPLPRAAREGQVLSLSAGAPAAEPHVPKAHTQHRSAHVHTSRRRHHTTAWGDAIPLLDFFMHDPKREQGLLKPALPQAPGLGCWFGQT